MKQIILSTMSEREISAYLIGDFEKKIIDPSTISNNELLEAEVILILEKNEQNRQETMQRTRFTKKQIIFIVYLENEEQNFSKKSGAEGNSIEYIIAPINQQSINDRIQNLKKNLQNETSSFQNMIQDFFSVLPEIAWYKDTQLKYQYVNQTFVENTEKTAKEIIGKTSEEIWGELYPEIMNRSDHEILADHTSKKFPIFFPGLKHSTFLEINKTPIFRESGELIGIFGFAKNISNFKDLENELQTTLESLPMGASIHDLEGTLICFNDMYQFFCDRPIIIGENVYSSSFDYFNKALDFTREQDQVLIETGNPIVYETEILTDGQKRRIECTKTPILDFQNQVARILVLVRDVTEVFYQEQRMKELAFCDSLTQLANRRRLYESVKLAQESENYSCLFIADIINFKKFNAHFGYEFGNKILIACARRLKQQNFSALLSRDSDEFSIFMIFEKKPTAAMMSQYAQDIFNCLSKPIEVFDAYYTLDIKIGFSTAECNIPIFENIIHHSEYALKIAKDSDLQTIVEYDDHLVEQIRINEQLIMDFEQALHHNEIELFYQPQFTCQRKLVGFEALFRWPNNKFLQFNTEEIIRKIEKTSLIHKLGIYIFHKAFSFAENINKNRIEPLTVAINCSAYQIMSPDFVELIQKIFQNYCLDTSMIEFEITETVLLEDFDANIAKIAILKAQGFKIALDDFGTGYSSLNYLASLPLSVVKIDRSFIVQLLKKQEYRTLIHLIVDAAHALQLHVVAEGVETIEELQFLEHVNTDYIQGYYFSKPLSEADAYVLIENSL